MNQQQLRALEISIVQVDNMLQGLNDAHGSFELCENFYDLDCIGCPLGDIHGYQCETVKLGGISKLLFLDYDLPTNRVIAEVENNLRQFNRALDMLEEFLRELIRILPTDHEWRKEQI